MKKNSDFFDFPVYKTASLSKGKLVKSNQFPHAYLTVLIPESDYSAENNEFLKKIISALGISWDSDCRVRTFSNHDILNTSLIFDKDKSNYILGFGLQPNRIDTQAILELNIWNKFNNFNLLLTYRLPELKNNNVNKRILWNKLKDEFGEK